MTSAHSLRPRDRRRWPRHLARPPVNGTGGAVDGVASAFGGDTRPWHATTVRMSGGSATSDEKVTYMTVVMRLEQVPSAPSPTADKGAITPG